MQNTCTSLSIAYWPSATTLNDAAPLGLEKLLSDCVARFPDLQTPSCLGHFRWMLVCVLNAAILQRDLPRAATNRVLYDLDIGVRWVLFKAGEAKLAEYIRNAWVEKLVLIGSKLAVRENGLVVCPQVSSRIEEQRELRDRFRRGDRTNVRPATTLVAVSSALAERTIAEATYQKLGVQSQYDQDVYRVWITPEVRDCVKYLLHAQGCRFTNWALKNGKQEEGWSIPEPIPASRHTGRI